MSDYHEDPYLGGDGDCAYRVVASGKKCPDCKSEHPEICNHPGEFVQHVHAGEAPCCLDSFHRLDRCPNCGMEPGRRCEDPWHSPAPSNQPERRLYSCTRCEHTNTDWSSDRDNSCEVCGSETECWSPAPSNQGEALRARIEAEVEWMRQRAQHAEWDRAAGLRASSQAQGRISAFNEAADRLSAALNPDTSGPKE